MINCYSVNVKAESVSKEVLSENNTKINLVTIDGNNANTNIADAFQGFGCVTGNNSSRLLLDYKSESEKAYWEIMNYLFNKEYGAGLSHIKVELGSDVNSSSGTEPCSMRSAEEEPDVTRGAGWIFAADAKKINNDIKIDALRWSEPAWVTNAFKNSKEEGYEARYKWYKKTIDKVYDVYKLKLDYLSADQNETNNVDPEWIIYLKNKLKEDAEKSDAKYDYNSIKIVASDEVGSNKIADKMIENEQLRNAVDAIGIHYTTVGSKNMFELNDSFKKQIFYSEGGAPTTQAKYNVVADGSGLTGVNGGLDIANRFINSYKNGSMSLYEYQPAVASYYEGVKYYPKQLITACNPWSGHYEVDFGIWMTAHFMQFVDQGWEYIDGACYGDGKEATSISSDTSTNNYLTLMNPKTQDYTMILTNDSKNSRKYKINVKNLKKAESKLNMWQSIGPKKGQNYDSNWFKNIGKLTPVKNDDGSYTIEFEVKPYSILTLTKQLDKGRMGQGDKFGRFKNNVLSLPYTDDFDYKNYDEKYLSLRGDAPRYFTDQGGAFEVVRENNNNVLEQKITEKSKPNDWRYRFTVSPYTTIGDNRWANYSASINFKLDESNSTESNYATFGGRHITTTYSDKYANSGYSIKVKGDGTWELLDIEKVVASGKLKNFNIKKWHNIKLDFIDNKITGFVDNNLITNYTDIEGISMSGKVSIASGYFNTKYDELSIKPIGGYSYSFSKRIDNLDSSIKYIGNWSNAVNTGYNDYNRTASTGKVDISQEKAVNNGEGNINTAPVLLETKSDSGQTSLQYDAEGTGFNIVGRNCNGVIDVYIDDKPYKSNISCKNVSDRQSVAYVSGLEYKKHSIKLVVKDGTIKVDAIEVLDKVYN